MQSNAAQASDCSKIGRFRFLTPVELEDQRKYVDLLRELAWVDDNHQRGSPAGRASSVAAQPA